GWPITFIAIPPYLLFRQSRRDSLAIHRLEDRRPARESARETARRLVGPDANHRLEPESDELGLKGGIGHRVLHCRIEPIENRPRRATRREKRGCGLRPHCG